MNYVKDNNFEVACLQETWLNSSDKSTYQIIKDYGYKVIKKERTKMKGGGLMVLCAPKLEAKRLFVCQAEKYKTFEFVCCKLLFNRKTINFVNLYRLPYSKKHTFTIKMFLDEFELFLSDLSEIEGFIILCGDFNMNLKNIDAATNNRFLSVLKMCNLLQLNTETTHIKGGVLDLVIVDERISELCNIPHIDKSFRTDHFPLIWSITGKWYFKDSVIVKNVREFHKLDVDGFLKDLRKEPLSNWNFVKNLNVSKAIDLYNSTLTTLLDKWCPLTTKRYREKHAMSKWYNSELQNLKQEKRRLERKFRKHPNNATKFELKAKRNEYNYKLKETRSKFYLESIKENISNSKNLFGILRNLTGTKKEKTFPTSKGQDLVAEDMADFYNEKISKIRNDITDNASQHRSKSTSNYTINDFSFTKFTAITIEELEKCVSEMKNKTSQSDPAPTWLVKKSMELLKHILLHIVNSSLRENIFPEELKNALITPVIKDERKSSEEYKNYRPVSNMKFLSKLLEKFMYSQLNRFIEENALHAEFQSAYRQQHSCETALINIVDDIQSMLHNKCIVALVCLDLSAAFDTIDHQLLLLRLEEQFSIRGPALEMIKSYLEERTFSVVIGEKQSSLRTLKYGVPQGSVLGPLLYTLYTKPVEDQILQYGLKLHVYADDTCLYMSFDLNEQILTEEKFEECYNNLKLWMNSNFLKLNPEKTSVKIFKPKSLKGNQISFNINDPNAKIEPSTTVKLLGVTLGPVLDFSEFVSNKIQICNMHLRNLRAVRDSIPYESKVILVTNLIFANIDFCNGLLICSPKYVVLKLQRILNKAVRFIFGIRRRDHITHYLFKLHILPVEYRIKFKVSLIAFKIAKKMAPKYLTGKVKLFTPTTNKNLRPWHGRDSMTFDCDLEQRKNPTWITKMMLEWNGLPVNLRLIDKIDDFKKHLKTHYFKQAFPKSF